MNWTNEPATWRQIQYLKDHGYEPDHPLTKSEAVELIRQFGGQPGHTASTVERQHPELTNPGPFDYRKAVDSARSACLQDRGDPELGNQLDRAVLERDEFWRDTCREATEFHIGSNQVRELYRLHGCLFCTPTQKQVQEVLEALDNALPTWDRDHPELFYQTLKLNFPELVRHH